MGTTLGHIPEQDELVCPKSDEEQSGTMQPEKHFNNQKTQTTKETQTIPTTQAALQTEVKKSKPKQTIEIYIPETIWGATSGSIRKEFGKYKMMDFNIELKKLAPFQYKGTAPRDGIFKICICTYESGLKQTKEAPLPKPHGAVCLIILQQKGKGRTEVDNRNKIGKTIESSLKSLYGGVVNFVYNMKSASQGGIDDSAQNIQARQDLDNFLKKGQIQIYSRTQGSVQAQATIPKSLLINFKKKIKLEFAQNYICFGVDNPDNLSLDEPVIVVCVENSRAIADIKPAVKDLNVEKFGEHCVVYLHNRENDQLPDEFRNRDVTNETYLNKFACIIDFVYNQGYALYECEINTHADHQLNCYLADKVHFDTSDKNGAVGGIDALEVPKVERGRLDQRKNVQRNMGPIDQKRKVPQIDRGHIEETKNTSEEYGAVGGRSNLKSDKPWMEIGDITMDKIGYEKLLQDIKELQPRGHVQQMNIAVIGRVNAGKSSFVNTILAAFEGRVSSRARTGKDTTSVTKHYMMYTVTNTKYGKDFPHFRMCDTRGLINENDKKYGLESKNFLYLLKGHIKEGYEFDVHDIIPKEGKFFKLEPVLQDQIHCLCIVLNGSTTDTLPKNSYPTIAKFLKNIEDKHGLRYVILLTHMDLVCSIVAEDPSSMYHSVTVGKRVTEVANKLDILKGKIIPIVNYKDQMETTMPINILALLALRQLLRFGNDVLDNKIQALSAGL